MTQERQDGWLEQLIELERKATPGLWVWHGGLLSMDNEHIIWPTNAIGEDDATPSQGIGACGKLAEQDAENNKALIAALRNAAPALLEVVQKAQELMLAIDHDYQALSAQVVIAAKAGTLREALAKLEERGS
jgi:hypothetical protein